MFPLHERTQRTLCRVVFFPLCVLPTLWVAWWCVSINLASRSQELAREWSRSLGLDISVVKLSYPRPGETRLHDVRLVDPASKRQVATCPLSTVVHEDGTWKITLQRVDIQESSLVALWRTIIKSIEARSGSEPGAVRIVARDVSIEGGERLFPLTKVVCQVRPHRSGRELTLRLQPPHTDEADAIRVQSIREENADGGQTRWRFLTGETAIPTRLLAGILPECVHLGRHCEIQGSLGWSSTTGSSSGDFAGVVSRIDLARVTSVMGLGKVDGRGRLEVESARFQGAALTSLKGNLTSGSGSIDSKLLRQLDLLLSQDKHSSFGSEAGEIAFEQLAMDIEIDQDGWHLSGTCDDERAGALLVDRHEVLLRQTAEQASRPLRHSDVVALFAPQQSPWVPLGEHTGWLLRHLPWMPSSSSGERSEDEAASLGAGRTTQQR